MSNGQENNEIPKNHGATLVANTAFATVFVIAMIVLIPALWFGVHPIVIQALATSMLGAILGFVLWRRGHIALATFLHAGGLVFTGSLAFLGTQSLGGAAGILLLASVITAGGFLGLKGAIIDASVVLFAGWTIILFGDDIRPYLDMGSEPYQVPEFLVNMFVLFSIPAWGAYVVAIDRSNRKAWHTALENKERLEVVNVQLQNSQQQQAKIADLGLLALQDISVQYLETLCQKVFVEFVPNGEEFWPPDVTLSAVELQKMSLLVPIEYSTFVDGLIQIITTRRLREELLQERARLASELQKEQRLESLSRMAGGVAHDFNNALMVVTGVAEDMLHHIDANPRSKKGVETILTVSRHIGDMTNQLLLFAKGLPLKKTPVDVSKMVCGMRSVLERVVPAQITLSIDAPDNDYRVLLPGDQVERIVLNLVRNSSMAFHEGAVGEIRVETNVSEDLRDIFIRITDNGMGMDAQTLERAIEPYFSVRGSTGLGLSTVHGLIQQAGGRMEIESTQGIGTTVSLWLPTVKDPLLDSDFEAVPSTGSKLALLIDDETLVRQSVRLLLERLGWNVASCSNREEAESVLNTKLTDIEVVVCDIRLNNEDGFTLVDALKAQGLTSPVLYMTGYTSSIDYQLEGNEQLLVKPFQSEQLRLALEVLLENSPV